MRVRRPFFIWLARSRRVLNRRAQPRLFAAILIVFKLLKRAPPLQFRAVFRIISGKISNFPIFKVQNARTKRVKQSAIVAHKHDRALIM